MTASEVARQALTIGLDEIDRIVAQAGSGLRTAAKLGVTGSAAQRKTTKRR